MSKIDIRKLNIPKTIPDRVRRVYEQTGTRYSWRGILTIYVFQMTESIPTTVIEETFNVTAFNEPEYITTFRLEWSEPDGCYMICIEGPDAIDAFIECNDFDHNKWDVCPSEITYVKWIEIINAILAGVV